MQENFHFRTYGKGELASLYSPGITTTAARRKLRFWIRHHPTLMDDLLASGYTENARLFTPIQVRLIVAALGEP